MGSGLLRVQWLIQKPTRLERVHGSLEGTERNRFEDRDWVSYVAWEVKRNQMFNPVNEQPKTVKALDSWPTFYLSPLVAFTVQCDNQVTSLRSLRVFNSTYAFLCDVTLLATERHPIATLTSVRKQGKRGNGRHKKAFQSNANCPLADNPCFLVNKWITWKYVFSKHSSRNCTDRIVTRISSDRVAMRSIVNRMTDRCLWKHYLAFWLVTTWIFEHVQAGG